MQSDGKRRAGRALTFAVTGALLAGGPLGCGGATEETTVNEPEPVHTNEPAEVEPTTGGETGGGGTGETGGVGPGPEIQTNEPAPEK